MIKNTLILFVTLFLSCSCLALTIALTKGMIIKNSTKAKKQHYTRAFDSLNRSAIVIKATIFVVDFNNAVLNGNPFRQLPDKFYGVAINTRNGKNITIKNLTAKGYKVALKLYGKPVNMHWVLPGMML